MTDNGAAETAQQFLQPSDKADSAVDTSVDDTSASDDTSDNTHDTDQADAADDTFDADAPADTHVALDTRFHRAGGLVQKFDHAKGIFDFIPFSQSWRAKCKEIAHERSQPYLPNINKDEGEKFEDSLEQMADTLENQPSDMPARPSPMVRQNAQVGLSGNLERQNAMSKLSIVAGNVPPMKKRTKILQSLNNFGQQLVPAMKKRFDDFKYVLRCKPWKTLKVSIGVGLVVAGAVFPAAGAGIAVAGLVWAAVNAVMDAADEPCLGGTFEYVHARSCVVVSPLTFPLFPCVCVFGVIFVIFFTGSRCWLCLCAHGCRSNRPRLGRYSRRRCRSCARVVGGHGPNVAYSWASGRVCDM